MGTIIITHLNIFARIVTHIYVFLTYIYIFCSASNLLGSSWWNWVWFLATGCLLLIDLFVVFIELLTPTNLRYFGNFALLGMISISIKVLIHAPETSIIIFVLALLYIIELGLKRYTLADIFGVMGLFMVWPYVDFHNWYEIAGLIVFFFLTAFFLLLSNACHYFDNENKYKDDPWEELGYYKTDDSGPDLIRHSVLAAAIMVLCLLFINYKSPLLDQQPTVGYIYLLYCILGLNTIIKKNIISALLIALTTVCYFFFISTWSTAGEWLRLGMSSITDWLHFLYSSMKWIMIMLGIITIPILIIRVYQIIYDLIRPIHYKGTSMTCPHCRREMVSGAPMSPNDNVVLAVGFIGSLVGKLLGSVFGSAGRSIGGFIGKYLAAHLFTNTYNKINRNKLNFRCTKCDHEWNQSEEDGLIVRSRTRKSYKLKYLFDNNA